uniref:NADH dehydrogenase subunit 2 n=1 Tax=Capulus dilatatus TaxID=3090832 RepID=UPI002A812261|nr:NADH dehydrogenase subunit 2 [Capulus dilatatus]WOW98767.1 NADH dehydrogenase subunit 2 [Capulus dilatatus]
MFSSLPFSNMFLLTLGGGTLFSVSSLHWLGIWAGLEINLMGFLPMLVLPKGSIQSESAVKYFVIQALGSSFLIFGSLMTYSISYTWEINLTSSLLTNNMGLLLIISGLCLKLGFWPFHYWLPSVMAGLSWMSCLLLASWQKIAPLYLMICLMENGNHFLIIFMFCLISGGSSLMGGLGGINQTQIRPLLAYSSIGHLGWMLFALMHMEWVMKVYFFIYLILSICIFMMLWYIDMKNMVNLEKLNKYEFSAMGIIFMLLSLGGLPPLLGFVSKWLVMVVSFQGPYFPLMSLFISGSLMSLFYYLSLLFSVILGEFKKYNLTSLSSSESYLLSWIFIINFVSIIFVLNSDIFNVI